MALNILLLGSGGREHALAWGISRSPQLGTLYVAPGNAGIRQICRNVNLSLSDFEGITAFVNEHDIDLVVVGPEQPLVDGITDYLQEHKIKVFGPSEKAARLEGSKAFAKQFMKEFGIPTADYRTFPQSRFEGAFRYIRERNKYPVVLKASGLAGGKGVFICQNQEEVEERLEILKRDFTDASETLVVEEFMQGEEASVFVVCDGRTAKVIGTAQDHKRIGEGDTGLNTGGMGAYAPSPLIDDKMMAAIERKIILPTISGMLEKGTPYKGMLYLGLMITEQGPRVVEYNCRFGDPECQVVVPRFSGDLLEVLSASAEERLHTLQISTVGEYHCCVIMASKGYPADYEKGFPISGFENVSSDTLLFHSGTAKRGNEIVTAGGRVLGVVQKGASLSEAIDKTYREVEKIKFENAYYRSDIGQKGLKHVR